VPVKEIVKGLVRGVHLRMSLVGAAWCASTESGDERCIAECLVKREEKSIRCFGCVYADITCGDGGPCV